jgi:hypothetical protein
MRLGFMCVVALALSLTHSGTLTHAHASKPLPPPSVCSLFLLLHLHLLFPRWVQTSPHHRQQPTHVNVHVYGFSFSHFFGCIFNCLFLQQASKYFSQCRLLCQGNFFVCLPHFLIIKSFLRCVDPSNISYFCSLIWR